MRKRILILAVLAVVSLLFVSCAKSEPASPLEDILETIRGEIPMETPLLLDNNDLLDIYGIRAEDIEEQASLFAMNGIFPDEVLMIKAVNDEALSRIREKLDARLAEVMNQSKNYDAQNYAIAQRCKVDVRGLYTALFISGSHEKMTEIYSGFFK